MTVDNATSRAFSQPGASLSATELAAHIAGDAVFEANFVPSDEGSANPINPGLGPRFDNNSCAGCHTSDGRGRPPVSGDQFSSMIFRVSIPGTNAHGGPASVPGYGSQLELRAASSLNGIPSAVVNITYTDSTGTFADGQTYTLRVPRYTVSQPYRTLPSTMYLSPRIAPPNFGLGLLEAVPDSVILTLAAHSTTGGHPNYVWDSVGRAMVIGRFGLKANMATLLEQSAAAFNTDMGLTTTLFPTEPCDDPVAGCGTHAAEVKDSLLIAVRDYVRTLGVPARRSINVAQVVQGERLFQSTGCTSCHQPTLHTGVVADNPSLSEQTIHPYTDLLVHDMGPGLADGRPDYQASGSEWRTPPLWGIGLTSIVNGHTNFLHDGRARNLMEAVLWHDGQAANARKAVLKMSKADRDALIAFLNSL
jgi:CxxC motif-containing protein (DUF1111 family)